MVMEVLAAVELQVGLERRACLKMGFFLTHFFGGPFSALPPPL